jgi:dienelactone hydrolase
VYANPRLVIPLLCIVLLSAACGGGKKSPTPTSTSQTGVSVATVPSSDAKPTTQSAPSADTSAVHDEAVVFETSDGVQVHGHLYSTPGPLRKIVIFGHEYDKNQTAWRDFAKELATKGINALTFDFRGYGETGGKKDVSKIDLDMEAAVRFMKSRDYSLVYLIGGSMGGTAVLKVAARQQVAGVVAVSAPVSFMGLDAGNDVAKITAPKLFVAARGDEGAPDAVATFMDKAQQPKQSQLYDGNQHATEILSGPSAAQFKTLLLQFLGAS